MAFILNIDTSLENGFVGLSENERVIAWQNSADQKEHASFLQPAIKQLMLDAGKEMKDIDAVAVAIGPGSYTGLRVGLASAKGLCYALQKPLIAVNTLEIIALAVIETAAANNLDIKSTLITPMIDARRMEVFTATYNFLLQNINTPVALILDENSFADQLNKQPIIFSGNGMPKFKNICHHPNAIFLETKHSITQLAKLAMEAYKIENFVDVAYTEPFYAKAFHSTQQVKS
jgi:tRNA threonylcarbamoyladenosine biosynthesis protein TsaB